MLITTDDEVYRVDAVWLGPPNATFPWRARYSSYGIGLAALIVILFLQRRIGIPLGVFSVGWALVAIILITRVVGRRINYERPLSHVLGALVSEVRTPRRNTRATGGVLSTGHVRVRASRPTTVAAVTGHRRGGAKRGHR